MKRTLLTKIFLGFLLFGLFGFLIVATFTSKLSFDKLKHDEVTNLTEAASSVADVLNSHTEERLILSKEEKSSFSYLSRYLESPIWILKEDGTILYTFTGKTDTSCMEKIPTFSIHDFGSTHFLIGDFYGYFCENHLSVASEFKWGSNSTGYVIIHKPLQEFYKFHNELLNISYMSWGLLFVFSAVLVLCFAILVYRPIRTLSIGAKEFAKGNYSKKIPVHGNDDELGYIAASLNYMASNLDTIEETQRNFISNVSHDFRSPLTSIRGYVDAMLDGTIPPEMQEKYLNIILFETERLTKLTESLLELNKYEARKVILEMTDFDINGMIQQICETFEGTCKEKHLVFELLLSSDSLRVHADMGKIQQVLYNLIDNAIKFSHFDSKITIETISRNGKAYISIKDYGMGIPKDCVTKIWERFYKTDLSRGRDKRGTGLGLSIVKEIVEAHDENINVISTEGVGTEFIFTLTLT